MRTYAFDENQSDGTAEDYLIQHSAGSARATLYLARHRLVSLMTMPIAQFLIP